MGLFRPHLSEGEGATSDKATETTLGIFSERSGDGRNILPIPHSEISAHLTDSHRTMHSPNAFAKPLTRTEVDRNIVKPFQNYSPGQFRSHPIPVAETRTYDHHIHHPKQEIPHPPFNPASFPSSSSFSSSSSYPHFSPSRALTLYPARTTPLVLPRSPLHPLHTQSTHQPYQLLLQTPPHPHHEQAAHTRRHPAVPSAVAAAQGAVR